MRGWEGSDAGASAKSEEARVWRWPESDKAGCLVVGWRGDTGGTPGGRRGVCSLRIGACGGFLVVFDGGDATAVCAW